jgi:hypothetical protein
MGTIVLNTSAPCIKYFLIRVHFIGISAYNNDRAFTAFYLVSAVL